MMGCPAVLEEATGLAEEFGSCTTRVALVAGTVAADLRVTTVSFGAMGLGTD